MNLFEALGGELAKAVRRLSGHTGGEGWEGENVKERKGQKEEKDCRQEFLFLFQVVGRGASGKPVSAAG